MATTPIRTKNTGNTPVPISQKTHDAFIDYCKNVVGFLNNNFNLREQFTRRDRAYYREKDWTVEQMRAKFRSEMGDAKAVPNITLPVVMPQVESSLSYLADIFLTGYPIFPILSKPNMLPAAMQMETLLGEHSIKYNWVPNLLQCLRDGLKYNLMASEVTWENNKTWSISTDEQSTEAKGKNTETYYQGNKIKHLNIYNTILDTRVQIPSEMHLKGEFAGYTELVSRIMLKQLIADLGATATFNIKEAFESGQGVWGAATTDAYHIPEINPFAFNTAQNVTQTTNWLSWAALEQNKDNGIKYHNIYEKTVLYCRIIPSDFAIFSSNRNQVQIWKLIIINRKVVIHAERQTNAHNYLPIIVGQPTEDNLGWQAKSLAENAAPYQDAASALFNSGIESQRRKVYDRILYDPSRINKKDIDNTSAVARIPVKQVAYGAPLEQAVHTFPYRDEDVSTIIGMAREIAEGAMTANGQNRASQGQFQKGNKSRREFETVMGNSNGRNQMMAILLEHRFFQPIKEIIKLNILQYQPPTELYNRNTKENVKIDPTAIRAAALEFKLADGLLPVDKMLNISEGVGQVMQMTANNPAAQAEWDLTGMMLYALNMSGASWVNDFKRTPEQQQQFLQNTQATSGQSDAIGNPLTPTPTAA